MGAVFQRHPLLTLLAIAAAVLAGVIGLELALGRSSAMPAAEGKGAATPDVKLIPAVVGTPPEQAYPEMVARPLFIATRRPAPEAPTQQATMVKGQFILQGVTLVGDTRIALLREKTTGRTHRVERGKELNGITLASVEPDRVVLAQGGDREELVLTVQKGPPPPPVAAAPAQAPPVGFPQPPPPVPSQPAAAGNPMAAPVGHAVTGAGPFLPPGYNTAPPAATTPPATPTTPAQSTATPLTPEEVLARRRARRAPGTAQ